MIEVIIIGIVFVLIVVAIIIFNYRVKKPSDEVNVFTSVPFDKDKRIKP